MGDKTPEGAECRLIGENLSKLVGTRKLTAAVPLSGRYIRKPIFGLADVSPHLPAKVVGVGVKGKLIFWILSNDRFLLNTLAMTGGWSDTPGKHSRVRFDFDTGDPVYFDDARNFGTLKFIYGQNAFKKKLSELGPDMLSEPVTYSQFVERMDTKYHWSICKALMDQSVISGIGNYTRTEALYIARVNPHRLVGSLSSKEMNELCDAIRWVLRTAYENGGASIKNYKNPDGSPGNMQNMIQVYGKKKDPLGNDVIKELTADGRTTHWVPAVQK